MAKWNMGAKGVRLGALAGDNRRVSCKSRETQAGARADIACALQKVHGSDTIIHTVHGSASCIYSSFPFALDRPRLARGYPNSFLTTTPALLTHAHAFMNMNYQPNAALMPPYLYTRPSAWVSTHCEKG